MDLNLIEAFVCGYERLAPWADLLDQINVFPVADSDTGCNLKVSLAPLRTFDGKSESMIRSLLVSATGNSGSIAAGFFSGFLLADSPGDLFRCAEDGRQRAWRAIGDPKPGTMLTVFDELQRTLASGPTGPTMESVSTLMGNLLQAVRSTSEMLPDLKGAGVVDAGALGMFIYMEGFFGRLAGRLSPFLPVTELFRGRLEVSSSYRPGSTDGYCVNTVVRVDGHRQDASVTVSGWGDSVVAVAHGPFLKMHLHTGDPQSVRDRLASVGDVVDWTDHLIGGREEKTLDSPAPRDAIHIVTDAAGSLNRETALALGITLLDSYVIVDHKSVPETLCRRSEVYSLMRSGAKVSTAQASVFERSQIYRSLLDRYHGVLYLCVGSAFTGYYSGVMGWKRENDPDDRLTVIDSEAASGRLGAIALVAARYSKKAGDAGDVIRFAKEVVRKCEEYVFLDRLKYLAAGGRLSRGRGFFGDLLHMKPVISPTAQGAKQIGLVRDRAGQLVFAMDRLGRALGQNAFPLIVLQYTDNEVWVDDTVKREIRKRYPRAEILLQPLSLTSGVHMGPGSWALAFLADPPRDGI